MSKTACITGITGQDGSYLAEYLLSLGYSVVGIKRRTSTDNTHRIKNILEHPKFSLVEGDICDPYNVDYLFQKYQPDEWYNLAAMSHVGTSFEQPIYTHQVNYLAVLYMLESLRRYSPLTKFLQASSSEQFGINYKIKYECMNDEIIREIKYQDETTPFAPQSPYGLSKTAAHQACEFYRRSYKLFISNSICFNHESERRGDNFVTKKIVNWLKENVPVIKSGGTPQKLKLGNLNASRDWGHASDYIRAMYMILQHKVPDSFVVATGETHKVAEFLEAAFQVHGLEAKDYVEIDPALHRPAEVPYLCGCYDKIKNELGWKPNFQFSDLVKLMVYG